MRSASLPGGTAAASSRSRATASSPSSGASVSASHRRTDPPLFTAPPTTHSPGTSARQKSRPWGSVTGRSTQSRSAPLVPIEHAATPGRTAPTPTLASGPSAAPATTGSPGREPGLARGRRGELQALGRGHELAEPLAGDPGQGERLGVPVAAAQVEEPGPRGDRQVDGEAPGEPLQDELLDASPAPRPRDDVGGVRGEPAQLGQRRHRVRRRPRPTVEVGVRAAQLLRLGGGPQVGPGQQAGQRPAVGAERAQAVHRGADRDADDVGAAAPARRRPPRAARSPRRRRPRRGRARPGRARARAA